MRASGQLPRGPGLSEVGAVAKTVAAYASIRRRSTTIDSYALWPELCFNDGGPFDCGLGTRANGPDTSLSATANRRCGGPCNRAIRALAFSGRGIAAARGLSADLRGNQKPDHPRGVAMVLADDLARASTLGLRRRAWA